MKKYLVLLLLSLFPVPDVCLGGILEDVWNKYAPSAENTPGKGAAQTPAATGTTMETTADTLPGRLLGEVSEPRRAAFAFVWRYRISTYELHYEDPAALARTVYGIALHVGDIDASLAPERFVGGVLGYHYRIGQICDWLNAVYARKSPDPVMDEKILVDMLLRDGIVSVKDGQATPTGKAGHILAAAPGKKRSFDDNLRHERLHVFWDEDTAFRERMKKEWEGLSSAEKEEANRVLARYASGNEQQRIEEWGIAKAESSNMSLE